MALRNDPFTQNRRTLHHSKNSSLHVSAAPCNFEVGICSRCPWLHCTLHLRSSDLLPCPTHKTFCVYGIFDYDCDFPELKSFQRLYEYEQFFEQILSALQHITDIIVRLCQHIISLRKLWFIASAEPHVSCKINRLVQIDY